MFSFLFQGLALGFAAGAQPGPFQAYLINRSVSYGWRSTFIAAFAPLLSDGPIVALVLLVLSQVPDWFQRFLQIAGGLFVLYLAFLAFRSWKSFSQEAGQAESTGPRSLLQAAMMNALSPGPYLFWSLVIGPLIVNTWREKPPDAVLIVVGFYSAMITLNLTVVFLFAQAARLGDRMRKAMLGFSVIALAGFGLFQLWQGIFIS